MSTIKGMFFSSDRVTFLGMKTGVRVRVVENAGTALKRVFSSTNPWGSSECGRPDCVVCSQGDEQVQDCRRRNILYENRCTVCQVGNEKDDSKLSGTGKGIYVGESSRSMYERAKEHEADRAGELEESHQIKHSGLKLCHPSGMLLPCNCQKP